MKRVYFVILSVFSVLTISAQDIIYKTNGDSIVAKVLGTNHGKIKYANWENETVYIKSIPQGKVISISYENEKGDSFFAPRIGIQGTKFDSQDALLTRKGNHYYYNGVKMNKYEYGNFLAVNNMPAYMRFQNGYRMSNVGWALLGASFIADISVVIMGHTRTVLFHEAYMPTYYRTVYRDDYGHEYSYSDWYQASEYRRYGEVLGIQANTGLMLSFLCVSGILKIVSIPMISVGYSRMYNSVDIYNVEKVKKYQPSLSVKGGANGIGVALNF